MAHWKPSSKIRLDGIPEIFHIDDFCCLVKKGFFERVEIGISQEASENYKNAFKKAKDDVKKLTNTVNEFSIFNHRHYF